MPEPGPHICFVALNSYPLLAGDEQFPVVGGAELQQVMIARGLAQRGYRVSMVCWDFGQPDQLEIDGIHILRACRPDEGVPVLRFVWPRLISFWRCLKRANADIYYQRAAGMLTGVVAKFCARNGKKSVFACAGDPMISLARDRWIYAYGVRHVDRVVVQTEVQAEHFRRDFGRESVLISNCYELPPTRRPWINEHPREVLWVSTIRSLKQPEIFLELAESLPQQRFRMIGGRGEGESRLYETIRSRAHKLPNLSFMGFLPYASVEEYFANAAVVVNTSRTEGFPNTFLQAWARSVPTVSFFDCGARLDGYAVGRLVRSFDELKTAVQTLIGEEELRKAVGENCRRYYELKHTPDQVLDAYQQMFKAVLEPL